MSDYISFEMQSEIMKWFPVKSLIRFRAVSKQWKALIESSEFIANYYLHNTHHQQQKHLLVRYVDGKSCKEKYVSVVDDDTFPSLKFSVSLPASVKLLKQPIILSSQGLFCLYVFLDYPFVTPTNMTAVIWNPFICKSIEIEVPNVLDNHYVTVVGFGVCPRTNDMKLVMITSFFDSNIDNCSIPWQVEVYTLSSRVWRRPLCSNVPHNSIDLKPNQVELDGVVYLLGIDSVMVNDESVGVYVIISFDIMSEEFTEVCLPHSLAYTDSIDVFISKLKESFVVLEYTTEVEKEVCRVWIMEDGDTKSFTNVFTVNMTDALIKDVLGFRMSGELVIVIKKKKGRGHHGALFVFDPYLENISDIAICGKGFSFFASSYPETLLLLDH